MQVGMVAKKMFFDAPRVARSMDRATRKVLSRFGAFVRRRARSSIRKRRKVSAPGQPPSSHSGHLKRGIYFGYEAARRSVVIGPTPFRGTAEVATLLEGGGMARRTRKGGRTRTLRYRARPYMGPAFAAELPGVPAMWKNSVRP